MLRFRRAYRWIALWAAVLQVSLPAALSVADAIVQREDGQASVVHIEDHSHKNCRPGHPDNCVLCQTLRHCTAPAPRDAAVLQAAGRAARAPGAVSRHPLRVPYRTPHSRGPPA